MMEQGSRTKLVAALVLALVFGSGLVVGFAVDDSGPSLASPADASEGEARRPWVPVYESLNPTPEQRVVIEAIMAEHRKATNLLREELDVAQHAYDANLDAIIQKTRDAITEVFPEDRRAEYRRRLEERDRRREEERARQEARP
jgi:hypothetical protein